ncbi:iron(3+)-hydroxamate-binding protein yxeB [Paenibacillus sp. FSL A5-0031]|uniref:iron-hydroxamate ABC transporter substrate-binding protein n=1 Tax=Paenibacillus sp. FSL A5-0031 TaxID=1920420 RepID=UPI00096C30BA|nr:iron-hydroxamate ABC transporter substrate-binding protein [Paenibacillus sp. FSL A5-0031]OME75820.1 iron(3+)-hydroxamate-binding protein yxeB [Paenibacillus sp. FSL A5-0031]
MSKRKPYFILTLFLMLSVLVSACGGANNTNSNAATNVPSESEAPAATEAPAAEFRGFETTKGTIQIPVKPQRIVTDYYGGELLSVGANVLGVEPSTFENPFLTEQLKGAVDVGSPINVEKVLELKPDLIVVMYEESYESLSKIAPTLYIPYGTASNIYESVRLFGDIVGEKEKAEQFITAYDEKAKAGREKLKGVVDENTTVGIFELTDKGEIWMFGENSGRSGQAVYNALGLKIPESIKKQVDANDGFFQLSKEALPEYSADYMFMTVYDPEKKGEAIKQLTDLAVWKSLDAVKNNQYFENDFNTFYRYDPIAISGQVDLIVDMLIARAEENKK